MLEWVEKLRESQPWTAQDEDGLRDDPPDPIHTLWPLLCDAVEALERIEEKAAVHDGNSKLVDIARIAHPRLAALKAEVDKC